VQRRRHAILAPDITIRIHAERRLEVLDAVHLKDDLYHKQNAFAGVEKANFKVTLVC